MGAPASYTSLDSLLIFLWPSIQPLNPEWAGKTWETLDENTREYWRAVVRVLPGMVFTEVVPEGKRLLKEANDHG